jgi:hypothetical protein
MEDNALIYEIQLIAKDTACAAFAQRRSSGTRMYDISQNG